MAVEADGSWGDNLRGEQRREHGEEAAEELLTTALRRRGLSEADVWERESTDPEKQAIAWLLAWHTTAICDAGGAVDGVAGGRFSALCQEVGRTIDHRMRVNLEQTDAEKSCWVVRETLGDG